MSATPLHAAQAGSRVRHLTLRAPALALLTLLFAACASVPPATRSPSPVGEAIAALALAQVGRPYRYGGNGPDAFDCSGLVRFTHAAQGLIVPRTTEDQFAAARGVTLAQLVAGDLLFFRFDAPKVSHVGIYVGDGRFVHAPQSGRPVESRRLDDPAYQEHFIRAGRLH